MNKKVIFGVVCGVLALMFAILWQLQGIKSTLRQHGDAFLAFADDSPVPAEAFSQSAPSAVSKDTNMWRRAVLDAKRKWQHCTPVDPATVGAGAPVAVVPAAVGLVAVAPTATCTTTPALASVSGDVLKWSTTGEADRIMNTANAIRASGYTPSK